MLVLSKCNIKGKSGVPTSKWELPFCEHKVTNQRNVSSFLTRENDTGVDSFLESVIFETPDLIIACTLSTQSK